MNQLMDFLESHAGLILLCLGIVFLLDFIIRVALYGRNIISSNSMKSKDEKSLYNALTGTANCLEAYALIDLKNRTVISVSENIENFIGASALSVYADLDVMFKGFSRSDLRKLEEEYNQWNGKDVLPFEAAWNGTIDAGNNGGLSVKTSIADGERKSHNDKKINRRIYQIMIMPVDGSVHSLFVVRDITEENRKREALRTEVEKARQSSDSKTVFLSNMSHEIRTPLNGMLGMIGLAKMNLGDAEASAEYLDKAEELSKFLLSVINDILDMSRIESGKTELEYQVFDIRQTVDKLGNMFKNSIEEKGIKFETEMVDVKDPYVIGDELRLTQVITNFLSNASKFTEAGGTISLSIKEMNVSNDMTSWMFKVKDTGKGMSEEFLHKIFKPFEQEDAGIARKYGGSGLGMAIADNIIRLMNGQILVESELGVGTTFTVFIKLPIAEEKNAVDRDSFESDIEDVKLEGMNILLAEDHAVNATIVVKMLAVQGINVDVAANGRLAVEKFKNSDVNYYDAILMDIQMPEMDGWQATSIIRDMDRADSKNIPIYALSADAFVEDKRKSAETGMNGHVTKPIDFNELKNTLKKGMLKRKC